MTQIRADDPSLADEDKQYPLVEDQGMKVEDDKPGTYFQPENWKWEAYILL